MHRERLAGVWVAMPAPWTDTFGIDHGVVQELVARYAAAGLHGAYTTGTDGEMHVLDLPEFTALAAAFGRSTSEAGLPAQMGCTWSHTGGVIERARIAREHGIGQIQVALPSWVPLNDGEILRFFAALQEALPGTQFIHYNIARAGRFLTGDEYRAIRDVAPNLIGSKHTGGDVGSLIEIVSATPELDHFVVDGQIVPGALFGARGFYSFLANLAPQVTLDLWALCQAGDWPGAARLRERIDLLFRQWRPLRAEITGSPALGKIVTRAGIMPTMPLAVRPPYQSGEERHVEALRQLIAGHFPEFSLASS
ncbi:MAG: dihydrodipicolinate synthase family protein [Chloroflexota bacterium]|nr:dihydrodipicolinate synthase family protein [Chloroflexota bacterium]